MLHVSYKRLNPENNNTYIEKLDICDFYATKREGILKEKLLSKSKSLEGS